MHAPLLTNGKVAFGEEKYAKEVELHSSFVFTAV